MEMYTLSRARGFGQEVKRRIILGTYVLSAGYYEAYYRKASQVRTLMRRDFEEAFHKVDVILTPTAPTPAFKIGERLKIPSRCIFPIFSPFRESGRDPRNFNPCGFSREGLPSAFRSWGNISMKDAFEGRPHL